MQDDVLVKRDDAGYPFSNSLALSLSLTHTHTNTYTYFNVLSINTSTHFPIQLLFNVDTYLETLTSEESLQVWASTILLVFFLKCMWSICDPDPHSIYITSWKWEHILRPCASCLRFWGRCTHVPFIPWSHYRWLMQERFYDITLFVYTHVL